MGIRKHMMLKNDFLKSKNYPFELWTYVLKYLILKGISDIKSNSLVITKYLFILFIFIN